MPHPSEKTPVEARTAPDFIDVAAARRAERREQDSRVRNALVGATAGVLACVLVVSPQGRSAIESAALQVVEIARDLAPDGSWGPIYPDNINETRRVVEERVTRNSEGAPGQSGQQPPHLPPQQSLNRAG